MKFAFPHIARANFPAVALIALTACGGGSTATTTPPTYTIGGTVSGIDAGQSVQLQDNGGDDLTVSANGPFTFATTVASGGAYAVMVSSPNGKTCMVTGGSGTASANVTSVAVACLSQATVGGTVSGLVGQGLAIELSGSNPLQVLKIIRNGEFVFPPIVGQGGRLVVNIKQQPYSPTQRCVVRHESFVFPPLNVTGVNVVCGEFSYVTNAADDTISTFSVDASTGTIASTSPPVTTGLAPYAIASTVYSRDLKYLYVVNSGGNDLSVFGVDYASGKLTTVAGSPFAAGTTPRALALYSFANAGDYSPPPQQTHTYLYVANAGSDDVSVFGVDRGTGVPTPMSPASYAAGTRPSVLAIQPGGPFLYTASTVGSGDISAFLVNSTGGLTPISGSPFASGGGVSSLAFGVGGKFLYAANSIGGTVGIYGFGVDTIAGALTVLSSFPYPVPSCSYIVADQTGAYLYATTGTSVIGYRIDATTGALSQLPGFPIAVGNVQSVSIDPTNQFLYVANGSVGTVTGFMLNGTTGELTPMIGSPFIVGKAADFIATF